MVFKKFLGGAKTKFVILSQHQQPLDNRKISLKRKMTETDDNNDTQEIGMGEDEEATAKSNKEKFRKKQVRRNLFRRGDLMIMEADDLDPGIISESMRGLGEYKISSKKLFNRVSIPLDSTFTVKIVHALLNKWLFSQLEIVKKTRESEYGFTIKSELIPALYTALGSIMKANPDFASASVDNKN